VQFAFLWTPLLCLLAGGCDSTAASAALQCTFLYGGSDQTALFPATQDPYKVQPVSIAGRFAFKAVHLQEPPDLASVNLYTYEQNGDSFVLLHQSKYRAPYPSARHFDARYGFTGRQFAYSAAGRELEYWCGWEGAK
jgi:hypothetical protein